MNKRTKKEIKIAVKVFKETLESSYKNKNLFGIGLHRLLDSFSGKTSFTRLKNGNLRISGELNKICLRKELVGLPLNWDDWDIFPLVIMLHHKDFESKKEKSK